MGYDRAASRGAVRPRDRPQLGKALAPPVGRRERRTARPCGGEAEPRSAAASREASCSPPPTTARSPSKRPSGATTTGASPRSAGSRAGRSPWLLRDVVLHAAELLGQLVVVDHARAMQLLQHRLQPD